VFLSWKYTRRKHTVTPYKLLILNAVLSLPCVLLLQVFASTSAPAADTATFLPGGLATPDPSVVPATSTDNPTALPTAVPGLGTVTVSLSHYLFSLMTRI
jgi:hypothetical protein